MTEKDPYDTRFKNGMWQMYWEGYKLGKNIESYSDIQRRTARTHFERQYEQRMRDDR